MCLRQIGFTRSRERAYRNIDLLVRRIFDYFGVIPQEFERLKPLEDEIRHFKNIQVSLKDISDLGRQSGVGAAV